MEVQEWPMFCCDATGKWIQNLELPRARRRALTKVHCYWGQGLTRSAALLMARVERAIQRVDAGWPRDHAQ
tara:strand:+ start:181 stop:393 length:213 start_codon:yes stop_codon:yes gene_type:complete